MKKLKSKKGFTLIEMLVCVVTLMLISLICTTGMNMASQSYNKSMFESNSQALEYMLNTSIGDMLRYSKDVTVEEDDIFFTNEVYNINNGKLLVEDGYFTILRDKDTTQKALIVAATNYVGGMYIEGSSFTLEYDPSTKVYTGTYKIKSNLTSQERLVEFTYKSIIESI